MTPAMLRADDEAQALEMLHEMGCTDGLPVVIPSRERVERMVLAGGLDADLVLGVMGPAQGATTVERVAIAAVMAGCLPDHFPVVVAAVQAVCDEVMDLTEIQATTHNLGPLVIVNGPARRACGPIVSGFGALGPGHRANASIGRALRLAMINVGGGRPGVSDMALLGHPGKFTFCLAEAEEDSPFPPLHTSLGFSSEQSAVTVACVEAPHSMSFVMDANDETSVERLLRQLTGVLANNGSNNHLVGGGVQVIVLNPDHANFLASAGFTRESLQEALAERAGRPRSEVWSLPPGSTYAPEDDWVRAVRDPSQLLIVVAGGTGMYSAVMPSWGAGPHGNTFTSREVVVDAACEIPWADSEAGTVPV